MIWLRRTLAIPLILVFIIVFVPLLVVFRVNDTAGNPRFYIDQLRQANIYNFIVNEALPSAINEMNMDGDNPGNKAYISQLKPHLASIAKETVPPEWLQAEAEQGISAVLPYILGDTDGFRVSISLKERVEAGMGAVKSTLHKEGVFPGLYDQGMKAVLDQVAPSLTGMPLSRDDLKRVVNTTFPPQWCLTQIDGAISEVTPYFAGEKEHFTVRVDVDIAGQIDNLQPVVVDILKRPETYNYIVENVMAPAVKQQIQGAMQSPMGPTLSDALIRATGKKVITLEWYQAQVTEIGKPILALTDDEIITTITGIVPLEWYQARVTEATRQIFSYLWGTQPALELLIPLADRKSLAVKALTELVNNKAGMDVSLLATLFIDDFIDGLVPNQWTLNEASLKQLLGITGGDSLLGQAREWVQKGIKKGINFTDSDLRGSLGTDYKTIDDIRQRIAVGFVVTESELRRLISGGEGGNATVSLQNFDNIRHQIGTVRRYLIFAWLIPVFILFVIGVLGGRRWPGKLIWAASVLGMASLTAFILFGPVFSAVVQPQLNKALTQTAVSPQSLQTLLSGKGISIAENAIDGFIGGLGIEAVILLAVSILLIVLGVIWERRKA